MKASSTKRRWSCALRKKRIARKHVHCVGKSRRNRRSGIVSRASWEGCCSRKKATSTTSSECAPHKGLGQRSATGGAASVDRSCRKTRKRLHGSNRIYKSLKQDGT